MGCGKYKRVRAVSVGHREFLRVGVRRSKGPRGGYTEAIGKPRKYKTCRNPERIMTGGPCRKCGLCK